MTFFYHLKIQCYFKYENILNNTESVGLASLAFGSLRWPTARSVGLGLGGFSFAGLRLAPLRSTLPTLQLSLFFYTQFKKTLLDFGH
ncbi:MAG: hypothetical protein VSS75_005380 [Candidatus Parabeggiatoa sp.]|nr:hypothetical protein [Candidatus Parabeggiatoa sp.]